MRLLGNLLWAIFGGLFCALEWVFVGLLLCVTVIGIPWGKQCFKLAGLSLNPFGKKITREEAFVVLARAFGVTIETEHVL